MSDFCCWWVWLLGSERAMYSVMSHIGIGSSVLLGKSAVPKFSGSCMEYFRDVAVSVHVAGSVHFLPAMELPWLVNSVFDRIVDGVAGAW